jgi:hypothetical protein
MRRCTFDAMRYLLVLGVIVLLAGCQGGSGKAVETPTGQTTSPPSSETSQPTTPKPKPPRADGPPPAWLETEKASFWLGYSSYCWGTACVDFVSPSCGDPKHTPRIPVRRGELVTAHLAFRPTQLGLSYSGESAAESVKFTTLSRTPSWRAEREGAFFLFARAKRDGDASYVACIKFS